MTINVKVNLNMSEHGFPIVPFLNQSNLHNSLRNYYEHLHYNVFNPTNYKSLIYTTIFEE